MGYGAELAGIIRVGRIAALLQRRCECVYVGAGAERRGVAGIALKQGDIILEALAGAPVGAESRLHGARDPVAVLSGRALDGIAAPAVARLDAEEIVAGGATRPAR